MAPLRIVTLSSVSLGLLVALAACEDECLLDPDGRTFGGTETIEASDFRAGAALAGALTEVTIDNYTPNAFEFNADNTFKFHRPDGGRFRIDDLGGLIAGAPDVSFNVAASRSNPYTIYLDDMRSQSVTYSAASGRFIVDVAFESGGTEVWANCIENIQCVGDPNMHLQNANMRLELIIGAGDQLIDRVEATFTADVEAAPGVCKDNFFAFLCDLFAPDDNEVFERVNTTVETTINNNATIMAALNDGVRAILETMVELPAEAEITGVLVAATGDLEVLYDLPCSAVEE